jgi:DNA invertase Pin-like site-specific DNA recombinase
MARTVKTRVRRPVKRRPRTETDGTGLVGCYCRVSTRRQKNDSQRAEIARWAGAQGIPARRIRWFEDTETGKTLRRPGFEQLQRALFAGTIRTVIVWKLDRLSRRQREGINLLADWCERGIRVVVVTQQIDLSGAVGRMVAAVMFGLAEIELEYRRERQAAGIAVAKARGVYKGRRPGTTKAHPDRARHLRTRGLTVAEITNALNVSQRTAYRYLRTASPSHRAAVSFTGRQAQALAVADDAAIRRVGAVAI